MTTLYRELNSLGNVTVTLAVTLSNATEEDKEIEQEKKKRKYLVYQVTTKRLTEWIPRIELGKVRLSKDRL